MHQALRLFVLSALLAPAPALFAATQRVVAVGDVHGEYEGFVSILRKAGLINQKLGWTGGRTTLVQTGDFLDRGPDVRKVMDLLMSLERGAAKGRGRTIVLLGNHDVMNLTASLHDANPESYAAFADRRSEKRRQAGYKQSVALHERLTRRFGREPWPLLSEIEWNERHPLGFIEFQDALSRNGRYGRWIRSKAVAAKVDDTVFIHGGISPNARERTIEGINHKVRLEIEAFDRIREYLVAEKLILPFFTLPEITVVAAFELARDEGMPKDLQRILDAFASIKQWTIYDQEGPLWFRGFGDWSEEEGERHIPGLLESLGARRFVVGHTVLNDGGTIVSRFGGAVFLIDTGMLHDYTSKGRPSALEIVGDRVAAIYETGRVSLNVPPQSMGHGDSPPPPYLVASWGGDGPAPDRGIVWRGPDGARLPFRSGEEVAAFLREAKAVKVYEEALPGITAPLKVLVQRGKVRAHAVFRSHHREEENARWESGTFTEFLRDTYLSEIAAYELSRLLGLDTVPPTVPWTLKERQGTLQLWIENTRPGWHPNEGEMPSDPERWAMETDRILIFDALIGNVDRHEGNVLIDSAGKVWWIDHSRSFGRGRDVPADRIQRCERRLWNALTQLDLTLAVERLAPYMGPREIDALLERHRRLVALIRERIAERGESAVLYTVDPGPPLRSVRRKAA